MKQYGEIHPITPSKVQVAHAGRGRTRDVVDRADPPIGGQMKVAAQSCSLFKVAKVAKVVTEAKCSEFQRKPCNFKVASRKLLQFPPL